MFGVSRSGIFNIKKPLGFGELYVYPVYPKTWEGHARST